MEFEVVTGIISGATVAPIVSVVDKAIFSNASGKASFTESFKESAMLVARKPVQFLKGPSFLWIWAVYAATYVASNCMDRYSRTKGLDTASTVLVATSATNIGMSVLKDRAFSRMYGTTAPRPIPFTSLACYATRDFITVSASFTFVAPVARELESMFGIQKSTALLLSQLTCPLVAQLVNTPIFLYGMDLYNKPVATTDQRVDFIKAQYWKTWLSRIARIGPAFSIGGVVNRFLRSTLTSPIQEANK
jgi:hypothetical protein